MNNSNEYERYAQVFIFMSTISTGPFIQLKFLKKKKKGQFSAKIPTKLYLPQ